MKNEPLTFSLPAVDASAEVWIARLEFQTDKYNAARRRHTDKLVEKARIARDGFTLKKDIIMELRAGGMAVTPANKEYANDDRWAEHLAKLDEIDAEITNLDCERSNASHEYETTVAAFARISAEATPKMLTHVMQVDTSDSVRLLDRIARAMEQSNTLARQYGARG